MGEHGIDVSGGSLRMTVHQWLDAEDAERLSQAEKRRMRDGKGVNYGLQAMVRYGGSCNLHRVTILTNRVQVPIEVSGRAVKAISMVSISRLGRFSAERLTSAARSSIVA